MVMVEKSKNLGLKIGAVFTVISFLLTFTLAIPLASIIPALFIEQKLSDIFSNLTYPKIGLMMIFLLSLLFLLILVLVFGNVKRRAKQKMSLHAGNLMLTMCVFYLIVHSLGYYLFWGIYLHFKTDAQLAFNSVYSFPFSSLSFLLIGFLLDWYSKKLRTKYL
ncbi:hypothetical protein D3C87_184390 [compost metagenome]